MAKGTSHGGLRFVQKDSLKYVPGNWTGYFNGDIFVPRGRGRAARRRIMRVISDRMALWAACSAELWLVLFPEGTFVADRSEWPIKERSDAFCRKAGRKYGVTQCVLAPRANGFAAVIADIKERGHVKAVYDFTCAYAAPAVDTRIDGTECVPKVFEFLNGVRESFREDTPTEYHVHIRRIPVEDLPDVDPPSAGQEASSNAPRPAARGNPQSAPAQPTGQDLAAADRRAEEQTRAVSEFLWDLTEAKDRLLLAFNETGRLGTAKDEPRTVPLPDTFRLCLSVARSHALVALQLYVLYLGLGGFFVSWYAGLIVCLSCVTAYTCMSANAFDAGGKTAVDLAKASKEREKIRLATNGSFKNSETTSLLRSRKIKS
jgi:1-acyl-sn-glycerol-3-phosphate acyltransferase